jgi:hypothetical protein
MGSDASFGVSKSMIAICGCRCWQAASFGSWPGVTFTQPVPNSGFTRIPSPMTGIGRFISGRTTFRPIRCL